MRDALSDIANQTYDLIETIVFNDGGPEMVDIGVHFPVHQTLRIVNHPTNVGPSTARNLAVMQASGEIITYLDDDDRWLPFHVETVVNALVTNAAEVAYTNIKHTYWVEEDGLWALRNTVDESIQDFRYSDLLVKNFIPLICVAHTRNRFQEQGGFDPSFSCLEDWEWLLRLTENARVFHVPVITAIYQHFEGQMHVNAFKHDALDNTLRIYAAHPASGSKLTAASRHHHLAALANAVRIDRRCRLPCSFTERMSEVSLAMGNRDILRADKILSALLEDLPNDGELLTLKAKLCRALGRAGDAEKLIALAEQSDPYVFPFDAAPRRP